MPKQDEPKDKGPRVQPGSLGWALFRDKQEGGRDPVDHPGHWYDDDEKPEQEASKGFRTITRKIG